MVSTCKKRQSSRRLLSQLDDFDRDINIRNTMSDRQENAAVNESTVDREYTVRNSDNNPTANEKLVKVKGCFNERIDWEMGDIVFRTPFRPQLIVLLFLKSNWNLSQ